MKDGAIGYVQRFALLAGMIAVTPTPVYASDFSGLVGRVLAVLVLIVVVALVFGALTAALAASVARRKWNWGVCLGCAGVWAVILFLLREVLILRLLD